MLMNHMNIHFTQIPDKNKKCHDFLKKFKNHVFGPFLTIFGHFCQMGIFFLNPALSHATIYGPLTPY